MVFDVVTPGELMGATWVRLGDLVPGDPQPGLIVNLYPPAGCPTPSRLRVADYVVELRGLRVGLPNLCQRHAGQFPLRPGYRPSHAPVGAVTDRWG